MKITIDDFRAAQSLIVRRSQELKNDKDNPCDFSHATRQAIGELANALGMSYDDLASQMAAIRGSMNKTPHSTRHHRPQRKKHLPLTFEPKETEITVGAVDRARVLVEAKMLALMMAQLYEDLKKELE
jgi:hypothetical protein